MFIYMYMCMYSAHVHVDTVPMYSACTSTCTVLLLRTGGERNTNPTCLVLRRRSSVLLLSWEKCTCALSVGKCLSTCIGGYGRRPSLVLRPTCTCTVYVSLIPKKTNYVYSNHNKIITNAYSALLHLCVHVL